MSVTTRKTEMWVRSNTSNGYAILKIGCPTSITGLGGAKGQVDITCLDDDEMQYSPGMAQPSTVTVNMNFDPTVASHIYLLNESETDDTLTWVIGIADGTAAPTVNSSTGVITYPTSRTYINFDGYISDFPFDIALNSVIKTAMQIQRSGAKTLHKKV